MIKAKRGLDHHSDGRPSGAHWRSSFYWTRPRGRDADRLRRFPKNFVPCGFIISQVSTPAGPVQPANTRRGDEDFRLFNHDPCVIGCDGIAAIVGHQPGFLRAFEEAAQGFRERSVLDQIKAKGRD